MNLLQPRGLFSTFLFCFIFCTAEREEGQLMESGIGMPDIIARAANLHNALIGQLWIEGGFFARLYCKKELCNLALGCLFLAQSRQGLMGAHDFLFLQEGQLFGF
jgi:hypothetical protein